MTYNWADISAGGGSSDWFGMADYSNFLKANKGNLQGAKQALDAAIASNEVKINPEAGTDGVKFTDYLSGNVTASQAATLGSQGDKLVDGQRVSAGGSSEYTGGVDVLHAMATGTSATDLQSSANWNQSAEAQEPIHNPWSGVKSFVDNSATNQRQGETIAQQATDISNLGGQYTTLQGNYNTLQGSYDTLQNKNDAMGKNYTQLQTDVAQAAKDALKIKYTGSTAVQNPSAMGIQAAQGTPFRGSGMAGAAALARPNKGLKIKTLNV